MRETIRTLSVLVEKRLLDRVQLLHQTGIYSMRIDCWDCLGETEEKHVPVEYSTLTCSFRIRQLRVKNDSCEVHPDFQNAIKQCYNSYSSSIEDEMPFGNGYRKKTSADA